MSRALFVLITVLLTSGVFTLMWWSWRARLRRGAALAESVASPAESGDPLGHWDDLEYVSTTPARRPYERVAIPGLAYRGPAEVSLSSRGLAITVAGEPTAHIPVERLLGVGTSSNRVGKAVEPDGLVVVNWRTAAEDPSELESGFRFRDAAQRESFVSALTALPRPAATLDA